MRKEARNAVAKRLEEEQAVIRRKLWNNKYEFKRLVNAQTQLKRELVVLHDLIKSLR